MSESQAVAERTVLEAGTEFARAYADGDYERMRELVAPDVIEREINPRGYIELRGPDELIAEAREFTGRYGDPEVLELTTEMAGPLVRVINRWRLRREGEPVLCDFYELLGIEDGRVSLIDRLVFGLGHQKGLEIAKDGMWQVDPLRGTAYVATTESGQEVLFTPEDQLDTTPLLTELRARFGTEWFTIEQADRCTLVDTPFRKGHLRRRTLQPAEREGVLKVERTERTGFKGARIRFVS